MIENGRKTSNQQLFNVPSTNEYEYLGRKHFSKICIKEYHDFLEKDTDSEPRSGYIIFSNIDNRTYEHDFLESHDPDTYIPSLKLLLVKMTTKAHEMAHRQLDKLVLIKLSRMNDLHNEIRSYGAAQIESGSVKKKADTSYGPVNLPAGHTDKWPTVAIETGYPESKSKLARDARWWLIESGGDVKTVFTVFVHQRKKEIIIERWWMIDRSMRTEEGKKVAEVVQKIVMSQVTDQPVHVTGAPLVVPFEDLFLRPVNANAGESDISLEDDDLKKVAGEVWDVHTKV
jgi:hypothetical protein